MRDAMFSSPSPLKDQLIRAGSLPRLLTRFLLAWLALSAVAIGNAGADDTIIVIPTVNSDVQSHAAVTVGSRLSRAGFRVTSPEPLLQTLKIGPVKAKFGGRVTLDNTNAPMKFSLAGEGDGGLAGYAKGGADVELNADGNSTILKYVAKAETGGKIAQLGGRLITSTARKLSKMFFTKFEKIMSGEESLPEEEPAKAAS